VCGRTRDGQKALQILVITSYRCGRAMSRKHELMYPFCTSLRAFIRTVNHGTGDLKVRPRRSSSPPGIPRLCRRPAGSLFAGGSAARSGPDDAHNVLDEGRHPRRARLVLGRVAAAVSQIQGLLQGGALAFVQQAELTARK
jgi:hypothetical protein